MNTELLIVADDLTGALDTGVKFSERGITSYVAPCFRQELFESGRNARVLVVNTESRHLTPEEAYKNIFQITEWAMAHGIPHIYKKTDSALRGNIGAELSALLEASHEKILPFLPAYPLMNRVTRDGYHLIEGIPVAESQFGRDPFEPVKKSYLPELLAEQCDVQVLVCQPGAAPSLDGGSCIAVFDAETDNDLRLSGEALNGRSFKISAGCAGFAAVLPDLLRMEPEALTKPKIRDVTLYVCGSVTPTTMDQITKAESVGFPVFEADDGITYENFMESEASKLLVSEIISALKREKKAVLASAVSAGTLERRRLACMAAGEDTESLRPNISKNLGLLTHAAADGLGDLNFVIFGGDTLSEVIRAFNMMGLTPAREILPGVVLAEADSADGGFTMITKSGGFGGSDIVAQIDDCLNSREKS